jgi:hypothetical protein
MVRHICQWIFGPDNLRSMTFGWSSAKVLVAETLLVRSEVISTKRELTNTLRIDHRPLRVELEPMTMVEQDAHHKEA